MLRGFYLEDYLRNELSSQEFKEFAKFIADDLRNGSKIFGQMDIAKTMKLDDFHQALNQMDQVHKEGRILFEMV